MLEYLFGSERRIGLWILPLFLVTALLGATLAGGLVLLYYSQQVREIRESTTNIRGQIDEAMAEVDARVAEALAAIDEKVGTAQEGLRQTSPIEKPDESGIYSVSATHEGGQRRVASGFTVFSDTRQSYLVTTYGVVATDDDHALERVQVALPRGSVEGTVHGFDRERDLAIVVLPASGLPVLDWRPSDETLRAGDTVFLVGVAGPGTASVVEGRLAAASSDALVPSLPVSSFTAGAPLVDSAGRVVGIAALGFRPFGDDEGSQTYAVPIRGLCVRLLRCTAADIGAGGLGSGGGTGTRSEQSSSRGATQPRSDPPAEQPPAEQSEPAPEPTGGPAAPPYELPDEADPAPTP